MNAILVGGRKHGIVAKIKDAYPYLEVIEDDRASFYQAATEIKEQRITSELRTATYQREKIKFGRSDAQITFYFHPDIKEENRTVEAFSALAKLVEEL